MTRSVVVPRLSRRLRWMLIGVSVVLAVGSSAALYAQDAGADAGADCVIGCGPGTADGLSKDRIRETIERGIPRLQQCFESILATQPALQGRVVLSFVIDRAGRVAQPSIESNQTGSRELGDCVLRNARLWTFPEPPPSSEVRVAYPFIFTPYSVGGVSTWLEGMPLPMPISPSIPDPTRPGSAQAFVERFGTCGAPWREGYVPSEPERKSFEAVAAARPKRAEAAKAVQNPAGPKEYLYQVETCYVRALEVPAWATLKGRVSLRLAIGADGKVVAARASAGELVPELGCCIQNAALEWRFAASGASRVVDYTFALKQPTGRGVDVKLID